VPILPRQPLLFTPHSLRRRHFRVRCVPIRSDLFRFLTFSSSGTNLRDTSRPPLWPRYDGGLLRRRAEQQPAVRAFLRTKPPILPIILLARRTEPWGPLTRGIWLRGRRPVVIRRIKQLQLGLWRGAGRVRKNGRAGWLKDRLAGGVFNRGIRWRTAVTRRARRQLWPYSDKGRYTPAHGIEQVFWLHEMANVQNPLRRPSPSSTPSAE
jgi:hypothetical protein